MEPWLWAKATKPSWPHCLTQSPALLICQYQPSSFKEHTPFDDFDSSVSIGPSLRSEGRFAWRMGGQEVGDKQGSKNLETLRKLSTLPISGWVPFGKQSHKWGNILNEKCLIRHRKPGSLYFQPENMPPTKGDSPSMSPKAMFKTAKSHHQTAVLQWCTQSHVKWDCRLLTLNYPGFDGCSPCPCPTSRTCLQASCTKNMFRKKLCKAQRSGIDSCSPQTRQSSAPGHLLNLAIQLLLSA